LKERIFERALSSREGKLSRRRVCPVGAVSKTTTEKSIPSTNLRIETQGKKQESRAQLDKEKLEHKNRRTEEVKTTKNRRTN
jgi:CRISPR/Cas system-associated protein Cas5 (RAMP superfamily)